jgi:hypothetical protein
MSETGKRFAAAMEDDARMEAVAKGLHMALRNLLAEITAKPADLQTDAEKTFVKAFVSITVLSLIAIPVPGRGGKTG